MNFINSKNFKVLSYFKPFALQIEIQNLLFKCFFPNEPQFFFCQTDWERTLKDYLLTF